jgi:hypothetical protein
MELRHLTDWSRGRGGSAAACSPLQALLRPSLSSPAPSTSTHAANRQLRMPFSLLLATTSSSLVLLSLIRMASLPYPDSRPLLPLRGAPLSPRQRARLLPPHALALEERGDPTTVRSGRVAPP